MFMFLSFYILFVPNNGEMASRDRGNGFLRKKEIYTATHSQRIKWIKIKVFAEEKMSFLMVGKRTG